MLAFSYTAPVSISTQMRIFIGMNGIILFVLGILGIAFYACQPDHNIKKINTATLPDIQLHYKTLGEGEPLILIHGSLTDLRYWKEQEDELSKKFKLIIYSRRYNYPNNNGLSSNHSAIVEAEDLLGLMEELQLEEAHILGHSYGAYTALWFALEHPEKVKKLILAEPPLMRWLPDIPEGKGVLEQFMSHSWIQMGNAFLEDGDEARLEFSSQWYFYSPLDSIPYEWKGFFVDNAKE